ncbi:histidinol-phosphatase [Corynebacterium heidelbergense]|uniref:Histidinol-phosphatase n=1 Tax=Corynebacterium heidelbergense TaxID=2055947 RepID=A0A364V7A0_9CORY|nr:histidinol-phosphatase [Corynebacterium heidelbergense]RAV32484.1 histidinol-phosphatase [Corynebacterium heidelbergense]WCZ36086.1 Histidinol-phosphatase [Corynebacterium heidelbergense]
MSATEPGASDRNAANPPATKHASDGRTAPHSRQANPPSADHASNNQADGGTATGHATGRTADDRSTPTSPSLADDLYLALKLADAADKITMARFEAEDLQVESKPDLTPVSDADTAVEREIRDILAAHRPGDAILGEEFGGNPTLEGRQWVLDPIDGTKNFVRGVPVWASLISLVVNGEPVVGVVSAPALSRRWWASQGNGAWRSFAAPAVASPEHVPSSAPRRLRVSKVRNVADASIAISSLNGWAERGLREQLISLTDEAWRLRGYGDFWSYMLVAEGAVDIAAEPEVNLWDLAALVPVVTEAGGRFTSLEGVDGPHGGSAVASNGLLHDATLNHF